MARRVDKVEPVAVIIKRHGGGGNGNAAVFLHLHEVRPRAPRLALGAHLAGHLDGATIEQKFFRQRGLARIGVRDDGEGPTPRDLGRQDGLI